MSESDDDWSNYETGPFCRHWGSPSDCDEVCANCGHKCTRHDAERPGECFECDCKGWKDSSDNSRADP